MQHIFNVFRTKRGRTRSRSRSFSESPKRYAKDRRSRSPLKSPLHTSKYDTPGSVRRHRSPSPTSVKISRYASSPTSSRSARRSPERSNRTVRIPSPIRYVKSPSRHRSDKHKHKHKY